MKKISLQLTDQQYQSFERAAEKLIHLGIPVKPMVLIETILNCKDADEITDDFLSMMKKLVNKGKKELRRNRNTGTGGQP